MIKYNYKIKQKENNQKEIILIKTKFNIFKLEIYKKNEFNKRQ